MNNKSKSLNKLYRKLKRQSKLPLRAGTKFSYVKKQAKKMSKKMTWPEREFVKLMKELKINFESQKIVGNKIYDFYIPLKNMLIEVDGDYYHANPKIYEQKSPMQIRNTNNDKYKETMAKAFGYKIERVWESDLKNNYKEVKEKFKKLIKY